MTSGGSSRPRRNSSASTPVVASSVSQPPSTRTRPAHLAPRSAAARRSHDRPEPVTGEDDPIGLAVAEQSRALGDGDGVARQDIEVVAAVLGRRVGQAVTAQVQSHEPSRAAAPGEPAGDRCPDPARLTEPVDRHDPRRRGCGRRTAPVEEMDAVAAVTFDHEARRLERRIRVGDVRGPQLHRP